MVNYIIRWRGVLQTISTTYHKFFFLYIIIYIILLIKKHQEVASKMRTHHGTCLNKEGLIIKMNY